MSTEQAERIDTAAMRVMIEAGVTLKEDGDKLLNELDRMYEEYDSLNGEYHRCHDHGSQVIGALQTEIAMQKSHIDRVAGVAVKYLGQIEELQAEIERLKDELEITETWGL